MWKDSYRIGVDLIDKQHKELFGMVEHLVDVVQNGRNDKKKECIAAISYMKNYTLQHFRDEEAYQQSIEYADFAEHKNIHQKFVKTVLHHEQKMLSSNFDERHVKDFMGTLIAWLVYHVAGTDQQIVTCKKQDKISTEKVPMDDYFYISTCDTLRKLAGLDMKDINDIKDTIDDMQSAVVIKMRLDGDASGTVTYKYAKKLAFDLIRRMAAFTPKSIDELVRSAILEISSTITDKALKLMALQGCFCIMESKAVQVHPAFLTSHESILFDTGIGVLEVALSLDV